MELLLMLTYAAICVAVFKIFRVPVNKWSVPTAVLGGIVIIGALVVVMNYNHPYSESVRQYYRTIPIVPQVRGRVIDVPVEPNTRVAKGDLLFRIDPTPYQEKVSALEAELSGARDDLANTKVELDRSEALLKKRAGSERETQSWKAKYDRAEAQVDTLLAELEQARFDLESTEVRAPTDGFVIQEVLREGAMAGVIAISSVMTFVPLDDAQIVGWFRQNSLLRLRAGDEAEVAFDGYPGRIFPGKVERVLPVIGEGQLEPTDDLITYKPEDTPGRVPVVITVDDPHGELHKVPMGLYGQAALYTEHAHHIALMRRILLRMSGWLNYLYPFH